MFQLFTISIFLLIKTADSTIHHVPLCPSTKSCDGCVEEVVRGQPTCRIYENSAAFSEIYEAEDTACAVRSSKDNGFEVWGSGTYVAYSKMNYDERGIVPEKIGETMTLHIATYQPPLAKPYEPVSATRSYILTYKTGDTVYELLHGSVTYIMIISKRGMQPNHLSSNSLSLPEGWWFQTRKLPSELNVYTPAGSTVVLDNSDNLYTSLNECGHYEHHSSVIKGLNWIIGISFLIILCCAASFMCIRLYYIRRKRLRKRKLVKKNAKVKRYNSASASRSSQNRTAKPPAQRPEQSFQEPMC